MREPRAALQQAARKWKRVLGRKAIQKKTFLEYAPKWWTSAKARDGKARSVVTALCVLCGLAILCLAFVPPFSQPLWLPQSKSAEAMNAAEKFQPKEGETTRSCRVVSQRGDALVDSLGESVPHFK